VLDEDDDWVVPAPFRRARKHLAQTSVPPLRARADTDGSRRVPALDSSRGPRYVIIEGVEIARVGYGRAFFEISICPGAANQVAGRV